MKFAERMLHLLPPETAHKLTLRALSGGLPPPAPATGEYGSPWLLGDKDVRSRIGLAAGADKNGDAIAAWKAVGFGFATIGTVLPRPHDGNQRPRVWRIGDSAMVNWMGLPSQGLAAVLRNIQTFRENSANQDYTIGVSLGGSSRADLEWMAAALAPFVDYFEVNISCPNVSNDVGSNEIVEAVGLVLGVLCGAGSRRVFAKLAPEPDKASLRKISMALVSAGVNGFVACNTVPPLRRGLLGPFAPREWPERHGQPVGGYSGPGLYPIAKTMIETIRELRAELDVSLTLIGCGGVQTEEALEGLLYAGADAVQLYTGVARHGIGLLHDLLVSDRRIPLRAELDALAESVEGRRVLDKNAH